MRLEELQNLGDKFPKDGIYAFLSSDTLYNYVCTCVRVSSTVKTIGLELRQSLGSLLTQIPHLYKIYYLYKSPRLNERDPSTHSINTPIIISN